MKIVLIDFYREAKNIKDTDVIIVKPRGFTKENDTADVRQYIIDLAIHHLLEKGEIAEGNFEVQIY